MNNVEKSPDLNPDTNPAVIPGNPTQEPEENSRHGRENQPETPVVNPSIQEQEVRKGEDNPKL